MAELGDFLVKRGAITERQLEEASQVKVVFGGRLGTNLVELGYLSIGELEAHLSAHLDAPIAPGVWLDEPQRAARDAVPTDLVARHLVLPLHLDEKTLHVAMIDPRDLVALDHLAFASGRRVEPYVVSEARLLPLLERHYEVRPEARTIHVEQEAPSARANEPSPQASPESELFGKSRELVDEETFQSIHGSFEGRKETLLRAPDPGPQSGHERSSAEPSVRSLEDALAEAQDRDAVSSLALALARRYVRAAALLVVRGGIVSGFRGDGNPISAPLDGILLPVESDCELTSPAKTRLAYRGSPPGSGLDSRLLVSLERIEVVENAVFPICIRGQVVNLLYTDNGAEPLADSSFAALGAVAELVSRAYERLILARKASV